MATNTYVALKTSTVTGSAVSSVTIDNIPGGYTDLVLVAQPLKTLSGGGTMRVQFNGDTSSVYSGTVMYQENNTTWSDRAANANYARIGFWNGNSAGNTVVAHFQNYANTNVHKTFLLRTGNASAIVGAGVQLWRSTAAITSMYIYNDGGNFDVGSTFTVYGIANADNFVKATGGIISEDSTYTYHVFGASGTFTPKQSLTADILVVAGGGGGADNIGGGGGAGGLRGITSQALSSGVAYTVTVGAGGTGGPGGGGQSNGTKGENSSISGTGLTTITATGGGYGAIGDVDGGTGGAGGGTRATVGNGGSGNQGGYSPAEGWNGGKGATSTTAGGGGGATAVGQTAPNSTISGAGGTGSAAYSSWGLLTGTGHNYYGTVYYAGGGAGGGYPAGSVTAGSGAPGGGGNGGSGTTPGTAGLIYSGGGGGGGSSASGTQYAGGNGGSGIVIIRYPK